MSKIMSAMSAFWWNECSDKRKIQWVSWPDLCKPKDAGGLGFRDIEDFNQALLAKQAWKILNEPQSLLAQVYKGRYFANKDFLECGKGYRSSYAWRSILFGRELLQQGLIKSIGNVESTYIWGDKWIMDEIPRRPVNKQILIDINLKVSSLIDGTGNWRIDLLSEFFPPNEVVRIRQMTPANIRDGFTWAFSKHGAYTVKTGFDLLSQAKVKPISSLSPRGQFQIALKKRVWKLPMLPKIRMFLWRAISGALAVAERLTSRGLAIETTCKLCNNGIESINHVLFQCSTALLLWSEAELELYPGQLNVSLEENLLHFFNVMEDNSKPLSVILGCYGLYGRTGTR